MGSPDTTHSLSALAERFELILRGDPDATVARVATLQTAGPDALSFFANDRYRDRLRETAAGAVIASADEAEHCPTNCLVSDNPYRDYARAATLFDRRPAPAAGVHPSAAIDASAEIGTGVHIGPQVSIGAGCRVGDGASIGAGSVLLDGSSVDAGSRLVANVTLTDGVRVGRRVLIHPGVVIGADGFGIAFAEDHWEKVPQLGGVRIGDDCEIGANSCIDRGAIDDTVLEEDVRLDNLVQVGHNCRIGAHTAIAGGVLIAGSCTIGRYCLVGGGAGFGGHIEVADRTTVAGRATVIKSITEPGTHWSSMFPAQPQREWNRQVAAFRRLTRRRSGGHQTSDDQEPNDD